MTAIQTILAATDFSPDAEHAVRRAALLAKEHGARLQLLHVVSEGASAELLEEVRHRLDELAREVIGSAARQHECHVRIGSVLEEIVAAADGSDLLVLGAYGQSRVRELLFGTTAERLLLKGRRPMLIVKDAPSRRYRNVMVPVDFSMHSISALQWARRIAPDSHLDVFHACETPSKVALFRMDVPPEVMERSQQALQDQAIGNIRNLIEKSLPGETRMTTCIENGSAKVLISSAAAERTADLIVMGKHGWSRLEEIIVGGTTRATVAKAECDVVVIPDSPKLFC